MIEGCGKMGHNYGHKFKAARLAMLANRVLVIKIAAASQISTFVCDTE